MNTIANDNKVSFQLYKMKLTCHLVDAFVAEINVATKIPEKIKFDENENIYLNQQDCY